MDTSVPRYSGLTPKPVPHSALVWFLVIAVALVLLATIAMLSWLGPLPPRVVTMSTGTPGSEYELLGRRYRTILKRSGVELRLISSPGGVENLRRLADPRSGVAIGFAQGGLTSESQSPSLESLGTMFFEPFWAFSSLPVGYKLEGLRGKKIAVGLEGSGTYALALNFLRLNGIDQHVAELERMAPEQAAEALLRGDISAAVMVRSWDSTTVRRLLASSSVNLVGFPRADAYVALYPYLTKLILPAGVGDLATNRPPTDVTLVAPKASLIVRNDLHPAIQYLLLEAAVQIHSAPSIFRQAGQFPAPERGDLPLSPEALQYYKSGPPFLQRYLPFWLAVLTSRLLVLLVPVVGILFPLLHFGPMIYSGIMRHKISRLYGELKHIEAQLDNGEGTDDVLERLHRLQIRASQMHIPAAYVQLVYTLRAHIELVQRRLMQAGRTLLDTPHS